MSDEQILHGLTCPRCGGAVPIPEGIPIVICPYCNLRSVVRGDLGVRRYQVPNRINREMALEAFKEFLQKNNAIAQDADTKSELHEALQIILPFWVVWGQVMGWTFGQKRVGTGRDRRYVPREVQFTQEMNWNAPACDVGEFGLQEISLQGRPLEPFNADALHQVGLVFEPTGSAQEAREKARLSFENLVQKESGLSKISQSIVRIIRPRIGLLYYPLWSIRYRYRGRSFQVVVDGYSGEVLYGKAPGNAAYRASTLVSGMALGAFVAVDISALLISQTSDISLLAIGSFVAGIGIMLRAYRKFRYGEHYEYRKLYQSKQSANPLDLKINERELTNLLEKLEDMA